jgi:integrase
LAVRRLFVHIRNLFVLRQRRDEAANARRENLTVAVVTATGSSTKSPTGSSTDLGTEQRSVWALGVIGKRRKQRTVPVSAVTVAALRAHWADREQDFDAAWAEGPLIAPIVINGTDASQAKHGEVSDGEGGAAQHPYAAGALARLVRESVKRIAEAMLREGALSHDAHTKLISTSAHAFRHYVPFLTMSGNLDRLPRSPGYGGLRSDVPATHPT